ncbi:MAG: TetR/AcrR family transcriptional regulator [Oceanicaulis sp.]
MQMLIRKDKAAWPVVRVAEHGRERAVEAHHRGLPDPDLFAQVRKAAMARFAGAVFHKVGVREIARAAGVGMAKIYEVAETKDALLQACLAPDVEGRRRRLDAASRREVGARARLRASIGEYVAFEAERPDFARIVRLNAPPGVIKSAHCNDAVEAVFTEILRHGQRDGSIRTDLSLEALTELVLGQVDGALHRWALADAEDPPTKASRLVEHRCELLWAMIWPAVCAD